MNFRLFQWPTLYIKWNFRVYLNPPDIFSSIFFLECTELSANGVFSLVSVQSFSTHVLILVRWVLNNATYVLQWQWTSCVRVTCNAWKNAQWPVARSVATLRGRTLLVWGNQGLQNPTWLYLENISAYFEKQNVNAKWVYMKWKLRWSAVKVVIFLNHTAYWSFQNVFALDFTCFQDHNREWNWLRTTINDAQDQRWRLTCLLHAKISCNLRATTVWEMFETTY